MLHTPTEMSFNAPPPPKIRVVLVEDNPQFLNRFEKIILESNSCILKGKATTGAEGLDLVKKGGYDMLLCDIGLPDFSGILVMQASAAIQPGADIMAVTLFGEEDKVMDSLAAGAKGYILKDDFPEDFIKTIQSLRAGHSPISPKIARGLLKRFGITPKKRRQPPSSLTKKEVVILKLLATGKPMKTVAKELDESIFSINFHAKTIYRKMGVNSKIEAANLADKNGWLE
ncbi:response regulator [Polynucleobacter sp.]|jgi:DNA-binding NarL/FixJ family response regulator|uniref:response regulator n=1 Tax=Polynucleobacter sp. TaxID=2029855 RepID=UPI0037C54A6F